jgi:hypothetical protein
MTDEKRPLKVFLCHASADKPKVRELYRYLKRRGLQPWLDAEELLPGQNWQVEIPKALETSNAIIICLSKGSVDKEGYVQKEIKFALDKALEMPEGRIFLIPARLEECDVPRSLNSYHWVDLFDESGYSKLMKSLKVRASQLERATVQVSKQDESSSYLAEKPKQESREGVSVHINGNVQGNIIIGNENVAQSQTVQPEPEKQDEPKPPVVTDKKEPEKPVSPPPVKQKELQKPPWKIKTEYIIAILGAAATILAALIGILPQIIKPTPTPTATKTATMPLTQAPTATNIFIPPSVTPRPSFTSTLTFTPTKNITPTTTLTLTKTPAPIVTFCNWTDKDTGSSYTYVTSCVCKNGYCLCTRYSYFQNNPDSPKSDSHNYSMSIADAENLSSKNKGSCKTK